MRPIARRRSPSVSSRSCPHVDEDPAYALSWSLSVFGASADLQVNSAMLALLTSPGFKFDLDYAVKSLKEEVLRGLSTLPAPPRLTVRLGAMIAAGVSVLATAIGILAAVLRHG
jgi:hypothetical protein